MPIQQLQSSVFSIFLSCVTKEFRPYRDMLAKDLSLPHVKVQVQEDFIDGGGSLLKKLDDYIKNCVAIIHLVGAGSGYKPMPFEVSEWLKNHDDFTQRLPFSKDCVDTLSYTQWEVWLAIYHEVSCYVYRAESSAIPATGFVVDPEEKRLQEEHWQRLREYGKDRRTFPSEHELRILVLRSLSKIIPSGEIKSHVIPKGLRSFDASDSAFFLDLLPGLHDENNLPESIRFWKFRIETRDCSTFTVGVIHGPSGCGKSSLVKAGLLPRLASHVKCVYVEATAESTESKLLKGLRHRTEVANDQGLVQSLRSMIEESEISGSKVLLVIDQFEQWLHGRQIDRSTQLIEALRLCDGEHLQCVVIVRDDFWSDLCRFMNELDVPMVQERNAAFADLFDLIHSENVLTAFGRGYGRLGEDVTAEQAAFVKEAVEGLSQNGRVISVQLALFAQMVKGKVWVPKTLKEIGGIEGVGFTFLEETFSTSKANPQYSRHEKAAQAVLKALLPETGTDIKGHMRSHQKLLEDSGYNARLSDFDDLIHILDELRLITPTSPETQDDSSVADHAAVEDQRYYQLTHDYLVSSLREWLTRKQKETAEGRAELLLEEWTHLWHGKLNSRPLPDLNQWINIVSFTESPKWTERQRNMMEAAAENHAISICDRIVNASTTDVLGILNGIEPYRRHMEDHLQDALRPFCLQQDARRHLHASVALLPVDATQVDYLFKRLLEAIPQDVPVIRDALKSHQGVLLEKLWKAVAVSEMGKSFQRLRAAAALADYAPKDMRWTTASAVVVNDLVLETPVFLGQWSEVFHPVKNALLPLLSNIFRNSSKERTAERNLAACLLAEYAADSPDVLANLLMDSDQAQFAVIFPKLKQYAPHVFQILISEIEQKLPVELSSADERREKLAKRQANAAVALFKLNQSEQVWPLLKFSPDPRVRSYLIHRLGPFGADAMTIIQHLDVETDFTKLRALLLSLGEFEEPRTNPDCHASLVPKLQNMYRSHCDPGIHGASEWLLRQMNEESWLKKLNAEWVNDSVNRRDRLEMIQSVLKRPANKDPQWYVTSQGQTLVVIPGPIKFVMGSPKAERGRQVVEWQHAREIKRTFAISSKPVTLMQYRRYSENIELPAEFTRSEDLPIVGINWLAAAAYCNWLSEREGFPEEQWCYRIVDSSISIKPNYLSLTGYRLPTETEMEFAARAGASTARCFGESVDLLPKYAWYIDNSEDTIWSVGSLKPNDYGMFDVHGNVWTWCQESYASYPSEGNSSFDIEEASPPENQMERVLRGGSFSSQANLLRSANRYAFHLSFSDRSFGFRIARSFPIGSAIE